MSVTHTKGWRRAVASLFILGTVGSGLVIAGPASASTKTFCTLMFKYKAPNDSSGASSEKVWAKANLSFIEKLEANAPNAKTKTALVSLVGIMKAEISTSSTSKLDLYLAKNATTISSDYVALADSIAACA